MSCSLANQSIGFAQDQDSSSQQLELIDISLAECEAQIAHLSEALEARLKHRAEPAKDKAQ